MKASVSRVGYPRSRGKRIPVVSGGRCCLTSDSFKAHWNRGIMGALSSTQGGRASRSVGAFLVLESSYAAARPVAVSRVEDHFERCGLMAVSSNTETMKSDLLRWENCRDRILEAASASTSVDETDAASAYGTMTRRISSSKRAPEALVRRSRAVIETWA